MLGRLTIDNALIALELFHYMRKNKTSNVGVVGLKLDMAKAYDRIRSGFIEKVIKSKGFPEYRVCLIIKCVPIISFSMLLMASSVKSSRPKVARDKVTHSHLTSSFYVLKCYLT